MFLRPRAQASLAAFCVALWMLLLQPSDAVVMETGTFSLPATDGSTASFVTVNFNQTFTQNPVVFVLPTNDGSDPSTVRIKNVTTTGFDVLQVEPENLDGFHGAMNGLDYLAIEPGRYQFAPGTAVEVGTHETTTTVQHNPPFPDAGGNDSVLFQSIWPSAPAVLAQIQTTANESGAGVGNAVPWLETSVTGTTQHQFKVALERAEVNDSGAVTNSETIGWMAITQSAGSFQDNAANTIFFDALTTTGTPVPGWGDSGGNGAAINFNQTFGSAPLVTASLASRNGADGSWLRRGTVTATGVNLVGDEDTFNDTERNHATDDASVVAFSQAFGVDALEPFQNDLILRYNFEHLDPANGRVPDISYSQFPKYDGTPGGDATLTAQGGGVFGRGLELDGTNDFLNSGDVAELSQQGRFSISLWFNRRTGTTSNSDGPATNHDVNNVLVAKSADSSNDNLEIGTSGANVEMYLDTFDYDGGAPTTVSDTITDGMWHHLVLTYDRDSLDGNETKLYVDNNLILDDSQWGGLFDTSAGSLLSWGIARPERANPWGDFDGFLDEIQVYGRALSAAEVEFLFQNPGFAINRVPEPATAVLLLLGAAVWFGLARRRR